MRNGSKDDYRDAVYDFEFITYERSKLLGIRDNLKAAKTLQKKMTTKIAKLASKPVSEALKKKVQRLLSEISNKNFDDLKSDSTALESFIVALKLKKKKFNVKGFFDELIL